MRKRASLICGVAVAAVSTVWGGSSKADVDVEISGFLRQEMAVKAGSGGNINNWAADPYNGVTVPNTFVGAPPGSTFTRPASSTDRYNFNQLSTRLEISVDSHLTPDLAGHLRLRGMLDEVGGIESTFRHVNNYESAFGFGNNQGGTPLEVSSKIAMLDLPTAYLDYNHGPLWLRVGNQQIAWGETLFFRVSDQVDGIDLRRHSVLGVAAEEYSDTRVPSLGVRGSYRINDAWEIEGFAKKFQPGILPGRNTPYNVIPSSFIVDDEPGFSKVDFKVDTGLRLKGTIRDFDVKAFAIWHRNPAGVISWSNAPAAGGLPGSAFSVAPAGQGVYSAAEWFTYATHSRLDGLGALEAAINEFPGTTALGANALAAACGAPDASVGHVRVDRASASCILDGFFSSAPLNGWLKREYPYEGVYGGSVSHVFEGEPDSLLDQLIGRIEFSVTPNKKFTNPTLSQKYITHTETQVALVLEKYYKFTPEIPATYMVFQYLHKTASDLFGRALEGNNNYRGERPEGVKGGANYIAFAFQQPSPTLEWRFDFTVLTDIDKGGWLLQPGARWKPNKDFQFDLYANVLASANDDQNNFAQDMDFAREIFLRATYFF